jgi:hypothetical protein
MQQDRAGLSGPGGERPQAQAQVASASGAGSGRLPARGSRRSAGRFRTLGSRRSARRLRGSGARHGTGGLGVRLLAATGLVLLVLVAACGDGDGITAPAITLDEVEGLYNPVTMTFDPQGAAPAGDVLAALAASGLEPLLNIALNGTFQVPYRDPVTGEFRTLDGTVVVVGRSLRLTFSTAAAANQLLMPRILTLAWDDEEETLHFSGSADVNRIRLQQLFPELYGQEPWAGETIPGVLTVGFVRSTAGGGA